MGPRCGRCSRRLDCLVWLGIECGLGPGGADELSSGGGTRAGEAHALAEAAFEGKAKAGFNCGYCDRVGARSSMAHSM